MRKKEQRKESYKTPKCEVFSMEAEDFFCISVLPQVPGTVEEQWGSEEEEDGGEIEL